MLREFIRRLWKSALVFLAMLLAAASVWWYLRQDDISPLLPYGTAFLFWLVFEIALYCTAAHSAKKSQPILDIYREKGICGEMLQKHAEIFPDPDTGELLSRIDMLLSIGRYAEAETLLDPIYPADVPAKWQLLYYNARMLLYAETDRNQYAYELFSVNRRMLCEYARCTVGSGAAGAFYATVSLVLAQQGDAEGSAQFCDLCAQAYGSGSNAMGMDLFLPRIACADRLYALGQTSEADAYAAKLRAEMTESTAFDREWKRQHLLRMLERAAERNSRTQRSDA